MPRRRKVGGASSSIMKLLPVIAAVAKAQGGRKRKRRVRGAGFLSDFWEGFKKPFVAANDVLKSTGVISKVLPFVAPEFAGAAPIVKSLGYGRKKRVVKRGGRKIPGIVGNVLVPGMGRMSGGMAAQLTTPSVYGGKRKKGRGCGHQLNY
jgi:hypothetical protein